MNTSFKAWAFAPPRTNLRLSVDERWEDRAAYWLINGYRARLLLWTTDEWELMETPPSDAQLHPTGVWCALRLD
jgi:hypothetical protein